MRCNRSGIARALIVLAWLGPVGPLAAETKLPDASASPERLVQAALESELAGPSELRGELLKQALSRDPNYSPARWQSGFVRWDNEWLTPDEVAKRAAKDPLFAEYRKRRDAMVDKADDHRELAAWCHKNKLVDEARVHWVKVLEFETNDPAALAGLGLYTYKGRLLTLQQIEQAKKMAGERRRATQFWQPQFVKWRAAIERGTPKQHDEALGEMHDLSDPTAIPALQLAFGASGNSRNSVELNLLLLETVGRMPHLEATQLLLRYAMMPTPGEVHTAAVTELRKRPMHAFVPLLIAAIPRTEFQTRYLVYCLPDLTVVTEHAILVREPSGDRYFHHEDWDAPLIANGRGVQGVSMRFERAQAVSVSMANQIEEIGQRAHEFEKRLEDLFFELTNFRQDGHSGSWLRQWDDYNESYAPPASTEKSRHMYAIECRYLIEARMTLSCFPAGTPTLTVTGVMPIEEIRAGDRVLAQNPQTGELAYKTVQRVTLRPARPLIKIGTGAETLSATRGHPFWVNGKGWLPAKQLKVGDVLHTLHGAAVIDSLAEAPAQEAYNLVVSDFNSYFAGNQQVLVHDNSPLQETAPRVPGLVTLADAP